jgi:hypothetical protein
VMFSVTSRKCVKALSWTLVTKELAPASQQAPSHTSYFIRECLLKTTWLLLPVHLTSPYLPNLAPCQFSVSHHSDTIEAIEAQLQEVHNMTSMTCLKIA